MRLAARPACHVCGHPVDSLEEVQVFDRLRFVARCHGAVEVVEISEEEAAGIRFGEAFAGARRLGA